MTFEELKVAKFVEHHKCGGCGNPIGYYVHNLFAIAVFNSGCGCGGPEINERLLTHEELAAVSAQ